MIILSKILKSCIFLSVLIILFQSNRGIASQGIKESQLNFIEYEEEKIGIHYPHKPVFLLWHENRYKLLGDEGSQYELFSFDICTLKDPSEIRNVYTKPYNTVGYLNITYYTENHQPIFKQAYPCTVHVDRIDIQQSHRRKGYAQSAFEIMIEWFPSISEVKQFTLNTGEDNLPAINLYRKLGFEIYRTEKSVSGNQVFMSKNNLKTNKSNS